MLVLPPNELVVRFSYGGGYSLDTKIIASDGSEALVDARHDFTLPLLALADQQIRVRLPTGGLYADKWKDVLPELPIVLTVSSKHSHTRAAGFVTKATVAGP